ncbi:hypothetical protein T10_10327 [Trichinella papuae]|uniref:Uncharacterized protein n=1 Tax=Trichinella papuae TaxID=268474 RepID=A0A0V1MHQ8_9BILA|nr:hypothetical protein T10_10327 [Trichinella papuae]
MIFKLIPLFLEDAKFFEISCFEKCVLEKSKYYEEYCAINLFLLNLAQSSPRSDTQGFPEIIPRRVQIRLYIFKAGPAFTCKLSK